jgi:small GTP-binding protein
MDHHAVNRKRTLPLVKKAISLPNHEMSIKEISLLLRVRTSRIHKVLVSLGEISFDRKQQADDGSYRVSADTIELLAFELGIKYERSTQSPINNDLDDREALLKRRLASETSNHAPSIESVASIASPTILYDDLPPRPPVVCVMGHVDHGKTTLMDALRQRAREKVMNASIVKTKSKKSNPPKSTKNIKDKVAGTEAGGITQVVTAFQVPLLDQTSAVTFLDTPGHAAFKAMRQSGSEAADIIVLVIAADDGVSPQTVEIINYYKSIIKGSGNSGISLVVAMNKIDKPGIDVEEARYRIQNELLSHGIMPEGLGGTVDTEFGAPVQLVPVSGLTGEGLDDLIEALALQSEIMNLRADENDRAEGIVLDSRIDKGLGVVVDMIIRWGSLEKGNFLVCGQNTGKVRLLKTIDDKPLSKGLPSQPVRVIGFESVPKAGEAVICVESEGAANELVARRNALSELQDDDTVGASKLDMELQSAGKHMMNSLWKSRLETKYGLDVPKDIEASIRIPIVVKADADGTLAAVRDALVGMVSAKADVSYLDCEGNKLIFFSLVFCFNNFVLGCRI